MESSLLIHKKNSDVQPAGPHSSFSTLAAVKDWILFQPSRFLGESFGVYPELPDGHLEIAADRSHYIAGDIRLAAFDSAKVVVAIPKFGGYCGLRRVLCQTHFCHSSTKHLTRCCALAPLVCTKWFSHLVIVSLWLKV